MKILTLSQKVSFIKYAHKWRPTNKKLLQMDYSENENAECTLCGEVKDDYHPFKCKEPIMRDTQDETMEILKKSLTKIQTYPVLIIMIIKYIKGWMRNCPTTSQPTLHSKVLLHQELQRVVDQQNRIG